MPTQPALVIKMNMLVSWTSTVVGRAVAGSLLVILLMVSTSAATPPIVGVPVNLVTLHNTVEGIAIGPDGNIYVSVVAFTSNSSVIVLTRTGEMVRKIPISAGPQAQQVNLLGEVFDETGTYTSATSPTPSQAPQMVESSRSPQTVPYRP